MLPGDSLVEGINEGINRSDVFLFIASIESVERHWPDAELKAAMMKRKEYKKDFKIIPVLKNDCRKKIPWLLQDTISIKFYDEKKQPIDLDTDDGKKLVKTLKNAILGLRSKPL